MIQLSENRLILRVKAVLAALVLLIELSCCLCASSAMEALLPFEDQVTQRWGYRNASGAVIISPRYQIAEAFSVQGIAAVSDEFGWVYIDRKGTVLIRPFIFDNAPDPFVEGYARFREAGKFGFFDKRAKIIIPPKFDFASPFSEGLAAFCQSCREYKEGEYRRYEGGKWGFIDNNGDIVIPPLFQKAMSFERSRARVMVNNRWLMINKKGDFVK